MSTTKRTIAAAAVALTAVCGPVALAAQADAATPKPTSIGAKAGKSAASTRSAQGGTYAGVELSAEQVNNARTIMAVGKAHGFDRKGQAIAIATAMQESTLRNLDYGDRDSLGLFQQRPEVGWGTHEQIMDPVLSSRAFYGVSDHTPNPGLAQIDGWESMEVWEAAYAVQRCAEEYKTYYQKHADMAYAVVDANGDVAPIS